MKPSNRKKSKRTDRPTLPELDQTKRSVLNSLGSLQSRRSYQHAMDEFIDWYCSEPRLAAESVPVVSGKLFRSIRKNGVVWGNGITQNVVWYVVKACAGRAELKALAPHDLRRTCARLCHAAGGELEQIQFLLGHASVQTTERYIGCKQDLSRPVNDRLPFSWDSRRP